MTEAPRDPEGPGPALVRMLRRRSRKERHGRARGGKSYQSWGEYAPRNLHTTGDRSHTNMWFYAVVGCAAPMLPVLMYHIALMGAADRISYSAIENATWLAHSLLPYTFVFGAFALILIAGSRFRIWSETRRHRKFGRRIGPPDA
jgi:hypothetical protein